MNLLDFIRQNNQTQGETQGQMAALQAAIAGGGDPNAVMAAQPGASGQSQQAVSPQLAKAATGTDTNMATGAPMDLATSQRIYQQNKQMTGAMSDDTEAKLTAAAQAGNFPTLYKYLPDDGKKLLDKMQKNGNLGFGDAAKLNGIMTGAIKTVDVLNQQKAQAAAVQAKNIANNSEGMKNQLQGAQLGPQLDALQRMQQLSQAQSGTGSGVLSPGAQQALQSQLQNPATKMAAQYFGMTGQRPTPEMMDKIYQQQRQVQRPVGVAYAGTETDEDGNGKFDLYNRVLAKGDGSISTQDTPIKVPYNGPAPDTLVDAKSGLPIQSSAKADNPDGKVLVKGTKYNDALAEAHSNLLQAQGTLKNVNDLMGTADALSKNAFGGSFLSALSAPGGSARIAAALGSPQAQQFNAQAAKVGSQMLSAMKGMTRNKNEFDYAQQVAPQASDDPATRAQKLGQLSQMATFMAQRQTSVKDFIAKGYSEGTAMSKAADAVPFPFAPAKDQPSGAQPQSPAAANPTTGPMPTVSTAQDFAALQKGTLYKTPKGAIRVK